MNIKLKLETRNSEIRNKLEARNLKLETMFHISYISNFWFVSYFLSF